MNFDALERIAAQAHGWQLLGLPYSTEQFVLEFGQPMEGGAPLPPEALGTPNQCFTNAGELALINPRRYTYCEGYALSRLDGAFLVHHAWLLDKRTGWVVERTWPHGGHSYFGIPFTRRCYIDQLNKLEVWSVLNDMANEHYRNTVT